MTCFRCAGRGGADLTGSGDRTDTSGPGTGLGWELGCVVSGSRRLGGMTSISLRLGGVASGSCLLRRNEGEVRFDMWDSPEGRGRRTSRGGWKSR